MPAVLAAAAFLLAFLQRPGWATSDTKIDLHVDAGGFLGEVAQLWSPTGSLGHVQGGQYGGYLWPMGPFFAVARELGLSAWVAQRLWLGALLALAAWGTVRLLDDLRSPERGVAHVVAGAVVLLNPYVIVFANRTSETLLGYAALPWLLLVAHRGVREPRRLAWAAAFALLVTSTGPGVNAATTAWVLLGPAVMLLYEPLAGAASWRQVFAFAWRAALLALLASLWWLGPVVGHALYGIDFLAFTEQPGSIWGNSSLSESLRAMGYWISYLGVGYTPALEPSLSDSPTLLFDLPVVLATLIVPALAVAGFVWTRRWRYGPFFLLLLLAGLLAMAAGFPEGTPLRRALYFVYNRVDAVQFLRTSYKAGPLVALGVACLAGGAAAELFSRARGRAAKAGLAALGALVLAVAAWPAMRGELIDPQMTWKRIPSAWTDVARDLDRRMPVNSRALVLPGQPFAFYRWGGTVDPILPALSERPVAVRNTPPYADQHATDLLWTVDSLVQQRRLLPGQLGPLLHLLGTRSVVTATDDRTKRSGAIAPADAAVALSWQRGFARPDAAYGPLRHFAGAPDDLARALRLPQVRRYDTASSRQVVRVEPAGPQLLLDGSAEGLAALAAFDALPRAAPVSYAGDRSPAELALAAAQGAELVISDSNRRRVFVASRTRQTFGATLGPNDPISEDAAVLNPFAGRGEKGQTVADYAGARSVTAPSSPGFGQFPEQRPFAAFDGDERTFWLADPALEEGRWWVQLELPAARDVPYVEVLPHRDARAVVTEVAVGGHRFAVRPGWNRLRVGLRAARELRVEITGKRWLGRATDSVGGFDEIRVPGLRVRERLRPPRLLADAVRGRDLSRSGLNYLFARTSGDDPFRRGRFTAPLGAARERDRSEADAELVRRAGDAETGIARLVELPATRSFFGDAWVSVSPDAPDDELDRLAGTGGAARFTSSSRHQGLAGRRASKAFDGDPATAWVGSVVPGRTAWLAWRTPTPASVSRLRIARSELPARDPSAVRLRWRGGSSGRLPVAGDGSVELPRPVRSNSFRLELVASGGGRPGVPAVAIADVSGPGIPEAGEATPGGAIRGRCGDLTAWVGGQQLRLRVEGSRAELDAGRPFRAGSCGGPVRLPAGTHELRVAAGTLRPELVRLRSPAPAGPRAASGGGRLVSPGEAGRGSHEGVQVALDGPSWLVLGEGYNRGWRAWCDGRPLGAPRVIDGFANGWGAPADCGSVRLAFAPQGTIDWAYILGALACAVLALVGLVSAIRRRPGRRARAVPMPFPAADSAAPWPLSRAAAAGLVAALALGFVFALRAGVVLGPLVAFVLWRGIGARALTLAAGALVAIVVPLLYLLFPPQDRGGYNTDYATDLLAAHWAMVGAVVLLALALWRTLSTARGPSGDPASAPAAAGRESARA